MTGTSTTQPLVMILDFSAGSQGPQLPGPNPQPYSFGTWGAPNTHTFEVFNFGGAATADLALAMPVGTGYTVMNMCGAAIAPSPTASCQVNVTFTPPAGSTAVVQRAARAELRRAGRDARDDRHRDEPGAAELE